MKYPPAMPGDIYCYLEGHLNCAQHILQYEVIPMTMQATVQRVECNNLLVFDHAMSQNVVVHTPDACRFRVGNFVCIEYNGIMTRSIPPQITAKNISVISRFGLRRNWC